MLWALCIVSAGADLGMAVNKETSACGTYGIDHVAIGRQNSQKMFSHISLRRISAAVNEYNL
jgi:hypothetical protein